MTSITGLWHNRTATADLGVGDLLTDTASDLLLIAQCLNQAVEQTTSGRYKHCF